MTRNYFSLAKICRSILSNYLARKTTTFVALFALMLLASTQTAFSQNALIPFNFTLSQASTTSAGIFKKDSTLVRTLWNNVKYQAGTHTAYWDRRDDDGRMVTDTNYVVQVISNNVTYKWEGGIVGNTSDSMTGSSKHRYFEKPNSMAITGNYAYFSSGYSEGITSSYKFNLSTPQNRIGILGVNGDVDLDIEFNATDGKYVYWAGFDAFNTDISLVYGTSVSADKEVLFSAGTSVSMTYGRTYNKALDANTSDPTAKPSGLAVQKTGTYLFVSHKGLDELHVLNKTTGALVQTLTVSEPRQLCVDMNDNLWMISGTNTVEKYTVNTDGTLSSATLSITGLSDPVAIAVSPNNYLIVVADAGTSQQLKAFNNASATSVWTLGQAGGYATDPAVKNDKFYFRDATTQITGQVLIAFQQDSSFWIGDPGNDRVQHFSASRTYINNIMSMPCLYNVQADVNNPTRVFGNFLEFKIDYSKPLAPNNGSWTLVRNWRRGVPSNFFGSYIMLRNVITLSNGRTYATMEDQIDNIHEFVELPPTGNLRFTGIQLDRYDDFLVDPDGTLRIIICGKVTDAIQWTSRALTGFSNNNPVWATTKNIGSSPKTTLDDPKPSGMILPAKTSSNRLISFCNRKYDGYGLRAGYHLGAVKKGTTKWLWKASKSTPDTYEGPMPTDGTFDIGNGVEYPAGGVYAMDNNIFWNYNGEFWKNSQSNIWNHYADNGLMVGQFGITAPDGEAICEQAFPMGAGNVFSSIFVKVGSDYYLYHNDESVHGAVHRWKISGLNTIQQQSSNISMTTVNGGLTANYFNGNNLNNINIAASEVVPTVNLAAPPNQVTDSTQYSVKWTGYAKAGFTENYTFYTNTNLGVRLWVDGNLVINKWTNDTQTENSSSVVKLDAGKLYVIKMEINGGLATLSWSSASQTKQIIPAGNLYPSEFPDYSKATDLMEGLHGKGLLANGMYGWNRYTVAEDNTSGNKYWHAQTGIKSFLNEKPDLYMSFRKTSGNCYVTRDLGPVPQCMGFWTIGGALDYDGDYPKWDDDNGSGYFDVLDDQGKVITRVVTEQYISGNDRFISIQCNGVKIFETKEKPYYPITNKPQPFEITVTSTGVVFKYADFSPITASIFDNTSNWNKPKTVKFHFMGSTENYDRAIIVHRLYISTDATTAPAIKTSGPLTICPGKSVTLTASPASTYLWSNNATTQSIVVSTAGTYSVTIKEANGCTLTSPPVTVTVGTPPPPVVNPAGTVSYCKGGSITLTSSNASSYLWSNNATTKSINVSSAGSYTVTVKDANGCTSTSSATTVTENALPTSTATPDGPLQFCQGKSVNLTASPASSYLWSNNETTQSIKVFIPGNYTVKVTDANGCSAVSAPVNIIVDPIPGPTVTPSGVTTFCYGNNVTLTSSVATSYLWSTNEITQSIVVAASGNYVVVITDNNGCSAPSAVTPVTVNPIPAPVISIANDSLLTSSISVGNQWFYNGSMINGANSKYHIAKKSGDYYVTVMENNCSGTSPTVSVVLDSLTGMHEVKLNNLNVYPNPSTGIFSITYKKLSPGKIEISNSYGQVVKSFETLVSMIDLSGFYKGVYMITVISEGKTYYQKLILQ